MIKARQCSPKDYYDTFTTPYGKRVLEDLRLAFGGSSYVKGSPSDTIYREGKRAVLLMIEQLIEQYNQGHAEEDE